jgi:hypothetical protein
MRKASGMLAGALVSKQLLNRRRNQRKVGAEFGELIGSAQQAEHAASDQIRRRFLAANHGDEMRLWHSFWNAFCLSIREAIKQALNLLFAHRFNLRDKDLFDIG